MTDETISQWSEPCTTLGPDVVSDFRAGSSTDADFADQTPREVQTVLGFACGPPKRLALEGGACFIEASASRSTPVHEARRT